MKTVALTILLICCSVTAYADPVTMQFTGVNGQADGADYVSPYQGTMNGKSVTLYCMDFANDVHYLQTWTANVTSLAGDDFSNTRYGSARIDLYREAAWLTTQFVSNPNDWIELQRTLWYMFLPFPETPKPISNTWLDLAEQNYAGRSYDDFFVVTNVGVDGEGVTRVQEFLVQTPEPAGIGLLATVSLFALIILRHRAKREVGTALPTSATPLRSRQQAKARAGVPLSGEMSE